MMTLTAPSRYTRGRVTLPSIWLLMMTLLWTAIHTHAYRIPPNYLVEGFSIGCSNNYLAPLSPLSLPRASAEHQKVLPNAFTVADSRIGTLPRNRLRMQATTTYAVTQKVYMPSVSSTSKTAKLLKWLKQEGDILTPGDTLAIVESNQVQQKIEAYEKGYLVKQLVSLGDLVDVGAEIALLSSTLDSWDAYSHEDASALDSHSLKKTTLLPVEQSDFFAKPIGKVTEQSVPASPKSQKQIVPKELLMPALSSTMKEGLLVKWLKKVGDQIRLGDMVLVAESDKADMEVESFDKGYLASILVEEGSVVEVGKPIALLVSKQEEIPLLQEQLAALTVKDTLVPTEQSEVATPTVSAAEVVPKKSFSRFVPPAVDQDIHSQLPPGYSAEDFSNYFIERVQSSRDGDTSLTALQDNPDGEQYFEELKGRVALRTPSGNILNADTPARKGSIWQLSGYARTVADALKVNPENIQGSALGGRVLVEDVYANVPQKVQADEKSFERVGSHTPSQIQPIGIEPAASNLAKQKGLDVTAIQGTGRYNRITVADVEKYAQSVSNDRPTLNSPTDMAAVKSVSPSSAYSVQKFKGIEAAIAKNMEASLTAPVFRVSTNIVTDKLDDLYSQLKSAGVTLSAILAKAVALTLEKHPRMNSAYSADNGGSIIYHNHINVAMAVALEDGLITPVLKDANQKSIMNLSNEWKSLTAKAKAHALKREEYTAGTFTISNLGMFDVSQFDAILPKDIGCIMSVASSHPAVIELQGGDISTQNVMTVTVTCDHRNIYGVHAAEFLKDLKLFIENEIVKVLL